MVRLHAYNREPFSKTEVAKLWDVKDSNIYYTVILMLIYTGCRIGELLDLKKENVNLEERYFKIVASRYPSHMHFHVDGCRSVRQGHQENCRS